MLVTKNRLYVYRCILLQHKLILQTMECVSRGKFQDALEMLHIKMHNTCSNIFKKKKSTRKRLIIESR